MKEIVIKIPDEAKQAFDNAENNELKGGFYDHGGVIASAIRNGKVLPKGHGELIDARAFLQSINSNDYDTYNDYSNTHAWITDADILVEEDRGEENAKS